MKKANVVSNLRDQFLEHLKKLDKSGYIAGIYYHLFSMMSPDTFDMHIKYTYNVYKGNDPHFKDAGKDQWFMIFHKSIRQNDFFTDCYHRISMSLLTDDELVEYKYLRHRFRVEKADKRDENGFSEEYKRYMTLLEVQQRQKHDKSISGHLDMLLWSVIQLDTDLLHDSLTRLFLDMDRNQKNTKI
jgi:hypothetical protein